jgi:hypothetical protein
MIFYALLLTWGSALNVIWDGGTQAYFLACGSTNLQVLVVSTFHNEIVSCK